MLEKVAGLDHEPLHRRLVGSATTLGGLVKHLAVVEDWWFTVRFAGQPEPEPWASAPFDEDRDWDFHSASDDGSDGLAALYVAACDRSRAVYETGELDALGSVGDDGWAPSLRWIMVHMIEETARHLGHMDILRELIDGTTGE